MFDEIISTAADGADFIKRQIEQHASIPVRNMNFVIETDSRFAFATSEINQNANNLFVNSRLLKQGFTVRQFGVNSDLEKKKLSLALVKAFLGVAHEFGQPVIHISGVHFDGPSFWPALGALLDHEPNRLAEDMRKAVNNYASQRSPENKNFIYDMIKVTEKDSLIGLRRLSQCDIKFANGRYWKEIPLYACLASQNLILLPGEPTTRKILTGFARPFA